MRITIVGCGYVGSALARHWQQDPAVRLTVTSTREERRSELAPLAERVEVLRADAYGASHRDSFNALAALVDGLPNLRQIVYPACCSVYGDAGGAWVDETTPASPRDDHVRVLLESEALLGRCRAPAHRVCVLRPGAIYGPGRELGERQHSRWIHRDDVVGAIAAAISGGWDGVVNLADDEPLPVAELLERVLTAGALETVRWDPAAVTTTSTSRAIWCSAY